MIKNLIYFVEEPLRARRRMFTYDSSPAFSAPRI